ncbi:MAG: glycosyltransferase [Kiritimatiellaeota bacterium]|nr:glycosyltransferase [Kiritimatiellota bacterium]
MHRVTFGIINFNGAATLPPVIEHLLAQKGVEIAEILLVDNASTDGSAQMMHERFGNRIRVLAMGDNRGPNPARNRALREAQTDLVLLLDNDILFAPDYAACLAAVFDTHSDIGAVTGQIRFHAEPEKIQYNGADIHYAGEVVVNRAVKPEPFVVGTVSAGAALLNRRVALDLGAYDEDLMFGWEDGDLTFRMTVCGHPCYAVSQAVCWHMSAGRSTKWVRLQVRNRWRFLMTHLDTRTFWLALRDPREEEFRPDAQTRVRPSEPDRRHTRTAWRGTGEKSPPPRWLHVKRLAPRLVDSHPPAAAEIVPKLPRSSIPGCTCTSCHVAVAFTR